MKMCPYCGNKVKTDSKRCPYCAKEFNGTKVSNSRVNNGSMIHNFSISIFACVFIILIIFIPALYIMVKNNPLGSGITNNRGFCRKNCNSSYDFYDGETYCLCKNGDVYNTRSGVYLFNRDTDLVDKFSSYREDNLNKFNKDFLNDEKMMVIVQSSDYYNYIQQIYSLINFSSSVDYKDVKIHYIEFDKLSKKDISRLSEISGEVFTDENVFLMLIDNGNVIYKNYSSFFHFDSSDLNQVLYRYSFFEVE